MRVSIWNYGFAAVVFFLAAAASYGVHLVVGPFPAVGYFVAIAFTAGRVPFGPVVVIAALSALAIDFFYLPPIYSINPLQDVAITLGFLAVALVVKLLNDRLRDAERSTAQLEGVVFAAGEMRERLSPRLSAAAGAIDLALCDELPDDIRKQLQVARDNLDVAEGDVNRFQQVGRLETRELPYGRILDLDRSTDLGPRGEPGKIHQE
ncbi:MAG TPA: DUF4118 domain-containing protein [Chloroflexota bacterium]|nr:DUF4118 domain-containing protein [Chloroflexota bacterium]